MKSLFVTGGSGLLGNAVARAAQTSYKVYANYGNHLPSLPGVELVKLDIRDLDQTLAAIERVKPAVIIHTAALRSLDFCEAHPEDTQAVNVIGTENVAKAAARCHARLIHISTESVFDGKKGMYKEDDVINPVTVYGKSKLEAEFRVAQFAADYVIARTSGLYGWSQFGKSLGEFVLGDLRARKSLQMFVDSFLSPTFVGNLSAALLEVAGTKYSGILNLSGSERCNRFTFAKELAKVFGLNEALVLPSSVGEVQMKVPRMKDSSLDVSKASAMLKTRLLNVRDGLVAFKESEPKAG